RLSVPANYVPLSREGGSVYIVSKEVHDYFSSIAEGGSLPVDGLGYHAIRVEYLSPQVVHTLKFQGVFDGPYSYKFSFRQQQVTLATSKGGSSDTGATAYIPIKDGRAIAISSICDCLGALETVTRLLIESDKAET
ncbi:MAG: hypothetical protein KME08_21340, partial [Aphanothece sp. CMT-3BRIN-NPC111]|nr:hypothetical protein [Aphanothece sp. CMT-3BRIN-NPC111]